MNGCLRNREIGEDGGGDRWCEGVWMVKEGVWEGEWCCGVGFGNVVGFVGECWG